MSDLSWHTLGRLVDDPERFARELWGRRPCCWRDRGPFDDLISTADVESLLRRHARRPSFRVIRDGPTIPVSAYTRSVHLGGATVDEVADVDRIIALVADGATVVIQGLQHTWGPLAELCEQIAAETSHRAQANAYLSPARTTGLRRHADTHDVLAIQVEGAKHWDVDGLGEVVVHAGDVLYVPAGVAHAAASRDRPSLHVTIGLHARTLRSALVAVVEELARELDGDAPLPLGYARPERRPDLDRELRAAVVRLSDSLRASIAEPAALDRHVERERGRAARRSGGAPVGSLAAVLDLGQIDGRTTIRLRTGVRVDERDTDVVVHDARQRLTAPKVAAPALRALADAGDLVVADLPGLDPESRTVLARRLIRDGFALAVPTTR